MIRKRLGPARWCVYVESLIRKYRFYKMLDCIRLLKNEGEPLERVRRSEVVVEGRDGDKYQPRIVVS